MDPKLYKNFRTSRGLNYHYYRSQAKNEKPTLLLIHGFPSTSQIWQYQVRYFKNLGYGLIVPDMLGYGGTDKPTAPELYAMKYICKDIDEILAMEKIDSIIAIGHDWGVAFLSCFAVHYPTRIRAYGFLTLSFFPHLAEHDIDKILEQNVAFFGRQISGYIKFFAEPDSGEIIMNNFDSFWSIMFADDPTLWKENLCPVGKAREWVLADRKAELKRSIDEKHLRDARNRIFQGGIEAPLCWYKAMAHGHTSRFEKGVPPEKYIVEKPVFYGAALRDYICIPEAGKITTKLYCRNATVVEYDADHWFLLTEPKKLNRDLHKWMDKLNGPGRSAKLHLASNGEVGLSS